MECANRLQVPVPTFFTSGSSNTSSPAVDLETQSKHSLFLVQGGIRGLVILGSTGEAIFVQNKERHELIKSQRKTLDDAGFKDRPIIAGTATQNIDDTIDMIKDSQDAGAEYAMVLTPGYFAAATSQTGIQKWFEAVADRSPIPIMMYAGTPMAEDVVESSANRGDQISLPWRDEWRPHCSRNVREASRTLEYRRL